MPSESYRDDSVSTFRRVGFWRWLIVVPSCVSVLTILVMPARSTSSLQIAAIAPTALQTPDLPTKSAGDEVVAGETVEVTMSAMLDLAQTALDATIAHLDDYTARLIKQEQDRNGLLRPASEALRAPPDIRAVCLVLR